MNHSFYLAWKSFCFYKKRNATIIFALALILSLPLVLKTSLAQFDKKLRQRSQQTPLIIGAKSQAFDLTLHELYFQGKDLRHISMSDKERIEDMGLAKVIALYHHFTARGFPLIATESPYFKARQLKIEQGLVFLNSGECVIGFGVANKLGLKVGDSIISDSQNAFDITGTFPLKMTITGILAPSASPDNYAVFCDLETAWIIQGLGHGHDEKEKDNAKKFTEITGANRQHFHFHGDQSHFPLSSLIANTESDEQRYILEDRLSDDAKLRLYDSRKVINGLLQSVLKLQELIQSALLPVYASALIFLLLILKLQSLLRRREEQTLYELGASQSFSRKVQLVELSLLIGSALIIALAMAIGLTLLIDSNLLWKIL